MKRTIATLCTALLTVPVGLAATGGVSASAPAPSAEQVTAAATTTSRLTPLPPARALDTRIGLGAAAGPLAPGGSVDLPLAGQHGVPADAAAVVLNVTITEAAGPGYVQAFPTGSLLQGQSSNLNVERAGQTIPNLVIVPLGAGGAVTLYNQAGGHLVADVLGAFVPAETSTVGRYQAINPARLLDTRVGVGAPPAKPGPNGTVELQVTGQGGVPSSGVAAVALNVTVTEATGSGYVQVVPTGGPTLLGTSSNLNADAGQTIANMVIVPVGAGGKVTLYTSAGTHLLADVTGWFTDASADDSTVGLFTPVDPARLLDTRGGPKPGANSAIGLRPIGQANVPSAGVSAVALNVTATEATAAGYVQAYPAGTLLQGTSSTLNVERAGQTIPNATIATLGANSTVALYTQSGTHLLADVSGWFSAPFSSDPVPDNPGDGEEPPDPTGPLAAQSSPYDLLGLTPRLIFSTQFPNETAPQSVLVHNLGGQPLEVTDVTVVGTNFGDQPASFTAPTPSSFTVPPGGSQPISLTFKPAVNSKVHTAELTMRTNDPSRPTLRFVLKGLNTPGFEGANEGFLNEIRGALGYNGIDIGSTEWEFGFGFPMGTELAAGPGETGYRGRFRAADPSQPVVMLPVASYTALHPFDDPVPAPVFSRIASNGTVTPVLVMPDDGGAYPNYRENQKLFPVPELAPGDTDGDPIRFTVPAGQAFAIGRNGQDTTDSLLNGACHYWRTYPLAGAPGATIPNSYLIAYDIDCVNGDFNDYVFVLRNVEVVPLPPPG